MNVLVKLLCLSLVLPLAGFIGDSRILALVGLTAAAAVMLGGISVRAFWTAGRLYVIALWMGTCLFALLFAQGEISARVVAGLDFAARFTILLVLGLAFALSTRPSDLPAGLQAIGVPQRFGVAMMAGARMVALVMRRARAISDAQRARGARVSISVAGLRILPTILSSFLAPALYAALETSLRLTDTILARGYHPDRRITLPPRLFSVLDAVMILWSMALLGCAIQWPR
jgi:energy-coupling factor transporter transmembrane protein EcfT